MAVKDVFPFVGAGGKGTEGIVSKNRRLNPDSNRYFGELVLTLPDIQFQAGDICYLQAVNNEREVDRLLQLMGIDASEMVMYGQEKVRVGDLFANKIEIIRTSERIAELLRQHRSDAKITVKEGALFDRAFGDEAVVSGLKYNKIADVIEYFGIEGLTAQDLATLQEKLKVRAYTASNSPKLRPNTVDITFALVDEQIPLGPEDGRINIQRYGVATNYMRSLKEGDKAMFYMSGKPSFRMPMQMNNPVVWCGPGTGCAPFKAMIDEIRATGKPHSDIIFYTGAQFYADVNGLHKAVFDQAATDKILRSEDDKISPINYAVSREGPKQRVTHLFERDKVALTKLFEKRGAFLYICGGEDMGLEIAAKAKEWSPRLRAEEKTHLKMDVY